MSITEFLFLIGFGLLAISSIAYRYSGGEFLWSLMMFVIAISGISLIVIVNVARRKVDKERKSNE